ncbi:hypothetical protein ACIQAL_14405 [Pseudomonas sp. NPDC088368]|uniref:hypothetical protein n=1 Tax=Pseudomonas sp. NPDC088368 TaxID=3364453 RepID=UPI0038306D57
MEVRVYPANLLLILAEGRGSWLAYDLARSGSKSDHLGFVRQTAGTGFATAAQPIASKLAPTPFGQKRDVRMAYIAYALLPGSHTSIRPTRF